MSASRVATDELAELRAAAEQRGWTFRRGSNGVLVAEREQHPKSAQRLAGCQLFDTSLSGLLTAIAIRERRRNERADPYTESENDDE